MLININSNIENFIDKMYGVRYIYVPYKGTYIKVDNAHFIEYVEENMVSFSDNDFYRLENGMHGTMNMIIEETPPT